MLTSSTSNSIIHKGYKWNKRIELYKGKSIVLSTVYNLHATSFAKITEGLSTHNKLTGYSPIIRNPSHDQLKNNTLMLPRKESISQC
uniref:Uncharacterized protein n=1 Tax=Arundo donax TaxID=35708 RepID=A0A0A9G9H5_ARUDO